MVASVTAFDYFGPNPPDDDLVKASIGSFYRQVGTSIVWYKYGANDYNWEPFACDSVDGWIYVEDMATNITFPVTGSLAVGAGTSSCTPGETGAIGVNTATVTSTVTPDRVRGIVVGQGNGSSRLPTLFLNNGKMYAANRVKFEAPLSTALEAFSWRGLGTDSTVSADTDNGVYFENDRNAFGDNNWRTVTAAAGVRTKTDTGVPPVAGVWQTLRFAANAAGTSVKFLINDTLVATHATNLPALGFGMMSQLIKTVGTVQVITAKQDYLRFANLLSRAA